MQCMINSDEDEYVDYGAVAFKVKSTVHGKIPTDDLCAKKRDTIVLILTANL